MATSWTTGLFALLGLISTFVSLSDLLDTTLPIQWRILISLFILVLVWSLFFFFCSIFFLFKHRIEIFEVSNGYHVFVQYGDIFSENEVLKPYERRNIVIPVNRCFDTIVDDDLISSNTLHGIAMRKLYSSNRYNEETLNVEIQNNIHRQHIEPEIIQRKDKCSGNLKRFPVGTVAEVKDTDICTYFFLGLSTFDSDLHAHTSDKEYVLALMKLLEFCNTRSQKYPVVMPLIGAGASETKKSERDILDYLIGLIKMNKSLINCDFHIIIRDSGRGSIPITNL